MKKILILWVALFLALCVIFKAMGESVYDAVFLALIGATVTMIIQGMLRSNQKK